jgi:hypothetical protein
MEFSLTIFDDDVYSPFEPTELELGLKNEVARHPESPFDGCRAGELEFQSEEEEEEDEDDGQVPFQSVDFIEGLRALISRELPSLDPKSLVDLKAKRTANDAFSKSSASEDSEKAQRVRLRRDNDPATRLERIEQRYAHCSLWWQQASNPF